MYVWFKTHSHLPAPTARLTAASSPFTWIISQFYAPKPSMSAPFTPDNVSPDPNEISRRQFFLWKSSAVCRNHKDNVNCWKAVVCVCVCTWRGGVIAGPNAFTASMKRPETLIKAKSTQRTQQIGDRAADCASCSVLLLRFLLIFNAGHLHKGSGGSASPADQTPCS